VKRRLLMLCRTQHGLDEEAQAAEHARSLGVPAEVLDAQQAAQLDPGAALDIAGAVHYPQDCHLTPNRFMAALRAECERLGVAFRWETGISAFTHDASRLTQAGEVAADEFVIAAGSWSSQLARELGLRLPLQAGKGYSLTLPKPRQSPQLGHILVEARVAVAPMDGTLRFGGTMEIAGLNENINPVRVNGIVKSALKYYPAFAPDDFRGVQPWCGLRPVSPDGLPYVGRTAKFANVTLATGHAMMGLSLGPITGKLVSEVIDGRKPSHDLALLNPDRYA
jgi:D-amino-acid dehydrogenase